MIAAVASSPSGVAHAVAGIPYRAGSAISAGSLAWAIFVTLLVLGAIIGGLMLVRRYGWFRPWVNGSRPITPGGPSWRVTARVRLSGATRAYVLEGEQGGYLVIESSQHLAVQPQAKSAGQAHAREE